MLVTGGSGGIGRYMRLAFRGDRVLAPSSKEMDLTQPVCTSDNIDVVVNCAIDMRNMKRSALMLQNIIDFSERRNALFVHVGSWVTTDCSWLPQNDAWEMGLIHL